MPESCNSMAAPVRVLVGCWDWCRRVCAVKQHSTCLGRVAVWHNLTVCVPVLRITDCAAPSHAWDCKTAGGQCVLCGSGDGQVNSSSSGASRTARSERACCFCDVWGARRVETEGGYCPPNHSWPVVSWSPWGLVAIEGSWFQESGSSDWCSRWTQTD